MAQLSVSNGRQGVLLVVLFLFGACAGSPTDTRCRIVLVNPRSGQQAAIGQQVARARTLVQDRLLGETIATINIEEIDSAGSPAVARAEVDRALSRWTAPVVVGSILSSETREFLEASLRRGVVVIANGSSDPEIRTLPWRRPGDGFFRNWPADDLEGQIMARYLIESGRARRLVVLHANDPYANALSVAFSKEFQTLGGHIVGTTVYDAAATAFDDVLRRHAASTPDGFYVVGFPADIAGIYNTVRRTPGLERLPLYSAVGVESGDFDKIARAPIDGLFYTAPAVDDSAKPYFDFQRAYLARFQGEAPDIVAAITYDALNIAVDAMRVAGCDADRVKAYLYSAPPYPGVSGPTGFDKMGDVVTKPVAIKYFEHGQRRLAKTVGRTN